MLLLLPLLLLLLVATLLLLLPHVCPCLLLLRLVLLRASWFLLLLLLLLLLVLLLQLFDLSLLPRWRVVALVEVPVMLRKRFVLLRTAQRPCSSRNSRSSSTVAAHSGRKHNHSGTYTCTHAHAGR